MTLTRDDVIDVLTACSSVDLRKIGASDVEAWGSTLRRDLNRDLAIEAVRIHYATSPERIMPAHVNTLAVQIRRDRAERENAEERRQREELRDRKLGLTQGDPQAMNLPIGGVDGPPVPGAYETNGAIDKACPKCKAEPMSPCVNIHNGSERRMPCIQRMAKETTDA